jgi:hypothetical protein
MTIDIGPAHGIPIIDDDDPRFEDEHNAWSSARARAQAMQSPDELLEGLRSETWMVRFEVVDRLTARAGNDPRTLPALLAVAVKDPEPAVRSAVVMGLRGFPQSGRRFNVRAATRTPTFAGRRSTP